MNKSRIVVALAGIAFVLASFMFLPMPNFSLWFAHFVALETSLGTSLLAALTLLLGNRWLGGRLPRQSTWTVVRVMAVPALILGLLPLFFAVSVYLQERRKPNLAQYVIGVSTREISEQKNMTLDPDWPQLKADVYRARGPGPHPFVIVVHGGSWRGGDKGDGRRWSRLLAMDGFVVVDVQYRLAPTHRFPTAVGDVKCLLGRVRERGREFDLDPNRGALLGRSAGGEIALMTAYSAGDRRIPPSCPVADLPVKGVISLYAATDLVDGYEHPVRPDIVGAREALVDYLGGAPTEVPEAYRLGSPLTWSHRPLPPTLLIHGEGDRIVRSEHSARLARGLAASGHTVHLLLIPMADHGFDLRPGGIGEQLARGAIFDFLRKL